MSASVGWRAVALALAVLCVPPVSASELEEAERRLVAATELFARNEYEQALEQVRKARALPVLKGDELEASLALWEGLLLLYLGKKDEFKTHLEVAFLNQPDLALPSRMSPKIKQRVEEVRATMKKKFQRPVTPTKPVEQVDPMVRETPGPKTRTPTVTGAVLEERPKKDDAPLDTRLTPTKITASAGARTAGDLDGESLAQGGSGGGHVAPLVLGGVAIGAGAAGAWFGLQSQDNVARARAEREQIAANDALGVAQDQAFVANVALAVAGTAALAAVITLLVSR